MPLYMTQVAYTQAHLAALTREPKDRTEDLRALADKLGCRLLNFFYSLGEYDALIILEAPNETALTATLLAGLGAGHIRATKTTQLVDPSEAVEAMRLAGAVAFTAPGGTR